MKKIALKNLLLRIKSVYLYRVSDYKTEKGYKYTGLTAVGFCSVVCNAFDFEESEEFQKFLKKCTKNQKVFYNCDNEETEDRTQFVWNPRDIQVRLDWLDEQISKLED